MCSTGRDADEAALADGDADPAARPWPKGGGRSAQRAPRSVGSRFILLSGANLLAAAVGFAVTLVIARALDPAGLGVATLALSILSFATTATLFGTDLYAVRQVAAEPGRLWALARSVTLVRLVLASSSYLVLVGAAFLVPSFRDSAPLMAVFGLSVFATAISVEWAPQALHRTHVTAAVNVGTQLLTLALMVVALRLGAQIWSIAISKVATDLVVALSLRAWLAGVREPPGAKPDAPDVWSLARASAPICATQFVRTAALSSDIVLLGLFVSATSLGHYASASKLFFFLLSLATAYFVILLPRISESASRPAPALALELRASLRRSLPLGLLGLAALPLVSGFVLSAAFGSEYKVAATALSLLGAAALANLVSRHYRQVLLARGRQMDDLRTTIFGVMVHVGAKVALIPLLGITGAALGTLIGELAILLTQRQLALKELSA